MEPVIIGLVVFLLRIGKINCLSRVTIFLIYASSTHAQILLPAFHPWYKRWKALWSSYSVFTRNLSESFTPKSWALHLILALQWANSVTHSCKLGTHESGFNLTKDLSLWWKVKTKNLSVTPFDIQDWLMEWVEQLVLEFSIKWGLEMPCMPRFASIFWTQKAGVTARKSVLSHYL